MSSVTGHILQVGTKAGEALYVVADPIPIKDISALKLKKILKTMGETLRREEDGVALAAPQIGVPLRLFIIRGSILAKPGENPDTKPDGVFINPVITRRSRETEWTDEGCLSVRNYFGKVRRSKKTTIRAYDEKGKFFERGASGLLAQIFQHETDHLNGILFTKHAIDLVEIKPEKHRARKIA